MNKSTTTKIITTTNESLQQHKMITPVIKTALGRNLKIGELEKSSVENIISR